MTIRDEINRHMFALIKSHHFGQFDAGAMGDTLLLELEESWQTIPDTVKAVMLGVAAELKRQYSDEMISNIKATQIVNKLTRPN
jgi:hypothetical protein